MSSPRLAAATGPLDQTYVVEVTDHVLNINFTAPRAHEPIVNALLVTEMPPGAFGF